MGDPFSIDSRLTAEDAGPSTTGTADGVTLYQPRALQAGEVIGHYRIEGPLGQGGAGAAYAARNIDDEDERVAVKLIRPDRRDRARLVRLLRAEAAALRRVKHSAIVQYRTFKRIPDSDEYYLVTEHIEGPTLGVCLREKALSVTQVRALAARVTDALETAHAQGVIHRDLSPDNIILPGSDPALATLIDFGIAKQGSVDPLGMDFVGKLAFAAPEQFAGDPTRIGPWTDLYSLGLVLAAAARGHRLDMGGDFDSALAARRAAPDLDDVPETLRRPIARLLTPDPEARIRSAVAAAALFALPLADEETILAPCDDETLLAPVPVRAEARAGLASYRRPRFLVLGAAAIFVLATAIYLMVGRPTAPEIASSPVVAALPRAAPDAPPAQKPSVKLNAKVAAVASVGRSAAALARLAEAQALAVARAAAATVTAANASAEAAIVAAERGRAIAQSACTVATDGVACKTLSDGSRQAGEQSCTDGGCVWNGYVAFVAGGVRFEGKAEYGRYKLGQLTGEDGSVYSGAFAGAIPNGPGRMVERDGTISVGTFVSGKLAGLGQLGFPDSDVTRRLTYTGSFRAGLKDGPGIFAWRTGIELRGWFKQDSFTGYGVDSGGDVRREAQFQEWYPAIGVALSPDGARYEGQFGIRNVGDETRVEARAGYGVQYAADGTIAEQGLWRDDKLDQALK